MLTAEWNMSKNVSRNYLLQMVGHGTRGSTNRWVGFRLDSITLVVLSCVVVGGAIFGWSGAEAQHNPHQLTTTQHPVLLVLAIIALRMLIKLTTAS